MICAKQMSEIDALAKNYGQIGQSVRPNSAAKQGEPDVMWKSQATEFLNQGSSEISSVPALQPE